MQHASCSASFKLIFRLILGSKSGLVYREESVQKKINRLSVECRLTFIESLL